jgi:hypothetical protein
MDVVNQNMLCVLMGDTHIFLSMFVICLQVLAQTGLPAATMSQACSAHGTAELQGQSSDMAHSEHNLIYEAAASKQSVPADSQLLPGP